MAEAMGQYMSALLDAAREVAIFATDAAGRITVFNSGAERLLGYPADEMLGQSPLRLLRPSELARRAAQLSAQTGRPVEGFETLVVDAENGSDTRSWTYVCRDGGCRRVSLTISAVRDEQVGVIGYLGLARDISAQLAVEAKLVKLNLELEQLVLERTEDLRSTQDQLVQSAKMASLGGLVAGVAHEINTPVGVTVTSASSLQRATCALRQAMDGGTLRKSDILAYLELAETSSRLILQNAERAADLVHSFKQVAVDQTSEGRRRYALGAYLAEVIASLRPVLKQAQVEVALDCPPHIVIDGVPGAMAQVLTNLTTNAVTHGFGGGGPGRLAIAAAQHGERVALSVRDDGCGIPAEHMARVFDPFFTTRRGQGGTGLGLHIVYNIVTVQFGGAITVDSQPGLGTAFHLSFPVVHP